MKGSLQLKLCPFINGQLIEKFYQDSRRFIEGFSLVTVHFIIKIVAKQNLRSIHAT